MMKRTYDIYGIGAALLDTEITLNDADLAAMKVDKGVMTLVDEARQQELIDYLQGHLVASHKASGGSAANTVIAASYFGCRNFFSCKVADDEHGRHYLSDIAAAGVTTPAASKVSDGITGKCLVMITPDAERTMNTFLGISATLSVEQLNEAAIADSEYVYIEGYLVTSETGKAAALRLHSLARQHHTKIALSLSDPAMATYFRDGLREMVGTGVDLIFCNQEEALAFTESSDLAAACQALRRYTKQFVITCGARATIVFDGTTQHEVPAFPVTPLDTNGAGDMFAGAFMYAIAQNHDFVRAATFANRAAAQVVSQYGPRLTAAAHALLKQEL